MFNGIHTAYFSVSSTRYYPFTSHFSMPKLGYNIYISNVSATATDYQTQLKFLSIFCGIYPICSAGYTLYCQRLRRSNAVEAWKYVVYNYPAENPTKLRCIFQSVSVSKTFKMFIVYSYVGIEKLEEMSTTQSEKSLFFCHDI